MTWFRVDDSFWNHPKVRRLYEAPGNVRKAQAAITLWLRAGTYCSHYLTDGAVDMAWVCHERGTIAALDLVRVGLWERRARGFVFHDYLAYNPSRADVERGRAKAAERKQKSRSKLRQVDPELGGPSRCDNDNGHAVTAATVTPAAVPSVTRHPSHPIKKRREIPEEETTSHLPPRSSQTPPDHPVPGPLRARQADADMSDPVRRAYAFVRSLQSVLPNIATHDVESWRDDWVWIAAKPKTEQRAVIATLHKSAWATASWQRCTPRHIRKYWAVYAAGEEPRATNGHSSPTAERARRGTRPVSSREDIAKLAETNPSWLGQPSEEAP